MMPRAFDVVPFQHILVPVDFGESSREALVVALGVARRFDARVTLGHTWEIPAMAYAGVDFSAMDFLTPIEDAARQQLESLLREVQEENPAARSVLARGVPWREIIDMIPRVKADLIVMGTHGRHGISRAVLGSVAEKVVRESPVPVLTVRAGAR
jgi:nucleotide-binding universal stress UspA family protein